MHQHVLSPLVIVVTILLSLADAQVYAQKLL